MAKNPGARDVSGVSLHTKPRDNCRPGSVDIFVQGFRVAPEGFLCLVAPCFQWAFDAEEARQSVGVAPAGTPYLFNRAMSFLLIP